MKNRILFFGLGLFLVFSSCEKDYDVPPIAEIPVGKKITLTELRKMYEDSVTNYNLAIDTGGILNKEIRSYYRFEDDYSVYATVTADEKSGNLYKNVYVQDDAAAIMLGLLYGGGLYQGDYIRMYLKGTKLIDDNGMMVLDSVDTDKNTIKIETKKDITPITITIADLDTAFEKYESKLVKLENIEMSPCDRGSSWADAVTKTGANRYVEDCNGSSLLVRTSGYASFAGDVTPDGSGSIVGVLGQYGSDAQLYIRSKGEIEMGNSICSTIINKQDFESELMESCGWTTYNQNGLQAWEVKYFGDNVAVISGSVNVGGTYVDYLNNDWLISPKTDVTINPTTKISFISASKYNEGPDDFRVYVSTNYSGNGNPEKEGVVWTDITNNFTLSTGSFVWTNSGQYDLSYLASQNVYVAFKYHSTTNGAATWELNDITISK